jgi:hypothetical protein
MERKSKPNETYFVVSDIHGFHDELVSALKLKGFDINNKKNVNNISGDFKIGKLAYVPVLGDNRPYGLRAVVIDSNNNRYTVNPNSLPIGIRTSKNYKAALKALGEAPAPRGATSGKSNQTVKTKTTVAPKNKKVEDLRTKYKY